VPYLPGEIVFAKIYDPDGFTCVQSHRAVIISVNEPQAAVLIVGITGSFSSDHPWYWVELPYASGGHPTTGLTKASVAKGNWFSGGPCPKSNLPENTSRWMSSTK